MDEPFENSSSSWDADSFEQWLEQMADSRDASNDEILNELASSLWVLDELEELIAETGLHDDLPEKPNQVQDSDSDSESSSIEQELSDLTDRFEAIESRLDQLESEYTNLDEEVSEDIDQLEASYSDLDEEVNDDIDHIEEVLRYLVDETDDLGDQLSSLDKRFQSIDKRLHDWNVTQSKVADLKATASKHGVTSAQCENCGNSVDVSMLMYPACPTCNHPFDSITPKRWLFGTSTIGTEGVASSRATPHSTYDIEEPASTSGRDSDEDADADSSRTDFEWEPR